MSEDDALPVPAPATVYLNGRPSRAQERLCDAVLELRPGLLFVCMGS